jgi:hypothetical protein
MRMAVRVSLPTKRVGESLPLRLRYQKKPKSKQRKDPAQYQLFETSEYCYRVFVTDLDAPIEWWGSIDNGQGRRISSKKPITMPARRRIPRRART